MERILTAAISTLLFSIIYSWVTYIPISHQEDNVYYFGFFEIFIFCIIYVGPLSFIAGIPVSILIDNFIEKVKVKSKAIVYLIGLFLYAVAGALIGIILVVLFNGDLNFSLIDIVPLLSYGIMVAILYFHLSLLISATK